MNPNGNSMAYSFLLNGEPVDDIPQWALEKMTERLSRAVSEYFAEHPEEYAQFAAAEGKRKSEEDP